MTDMLFGWHANERKRGLPRIIACLYALLQHRCTPRPILPSYPPSYTPEVPTSCHAPVINFHAPAGRCVAFVRIYGITRPPGRRRGLGQQRESGRPRRSRESRERLIFQGNTWRDISACIRSAVSAEVDSVDSISRNESPNFSLSSLMLPAAKTLFNQCSTFWPQNYF